MSAPSTYVAPIADREPLRWVLENSRTAFADTERWRLAVGDTLFLYTTRGCFRNPKRDRGMITGRATVRAEARGVDSPSEFGGRAYPWVVELTIETLAPRGGGLELAALVQRLSATLPDPRSWAARMRRTLAPLVANDPELVHELLAPLGTPYPRALGTYGLWRKDSQG